MVVWSLSCVVLCMFVCLGSDFFFFDFFLEMCSKVLSLVFPKTCALFSRDLSSLGRSGFAPVLDRPP